MAIAVQNQQIRLCEIDSGQRARMLAPPLRHCLGIARAEFPPFDQRLFLGIAGKY
jgi:hypothetical protein